MKKLFLCILTFIIISAFCGCSQNNEQETVPVDTVSTVVPEILTENSRQHSQTVSYPESVEEIDAEHLRFKSKSGKYAALFPKKFSSESSELRSDDSIYLTTEDGKASLQLDYVPSDGITQEDLITYLEKKYKGSKSEILDSNYIIFKTSIKDKKDNKLTSYLKVLISDDGYTEAVLSFHESENSKYSDLIDKIELIPTSSGQDE